MITIEVPDHENVDVKVDEKTNKLSFKATANSVNYHFDMEVFEPISEEESAWNTKGRNVLISLKKKEAAKDSEEWWTRITKEKVKN